MRDGTRVLLPGVMGWREFGHRSRRRSPVVEDHQRLVAAADAREGMADGRRSRTVPKSHAGFEDQTCLCNGGKLAGKRRDNEEVLLDRNLLTMES